MLEDSHGAVFVGACIAVELALCARGIAVCFSRPAQVKGWIRSGLKWFRFLLFQAERQADPLLQKESAYLRMHVVCVVTQYLAVMYVVGVMPGQVSVMAGEPYWMSLPQLWNGLLAGLLAWACVTFPRIRQACMSDILCLAFNGLAVVGLLPSHCPPQNLFVSWVVALILIRLPSLLLATRGVTVLVVNFSFTSLIFFRRSFDDGALIDNVGLSNTDPSLLIRLDFYASVGTFAMSGLFLAAMRMKAELNVDTSNLSTQLSAASSLLRLTCDAVVELDSQLRFTDHSPALSALLLHDRPGTTLLGTCFTDLMQPMDAARAVELLGTGSSSGGFAREEISAQAFHTRLVDSCASKLCAEIFQVKYTKCDGCSYHLLGIRDFTDIKSLAGANAVDAFAEGQDSSSFSSPVTPVVQSPRSSCADYEIDNQPKVYLDIDAEGLVVQAASNPLMAAAGARCQELFPSPHTTMLLEQLRNQAAICQQRGETPPSRTLTFEDMPAILYPPHVASITGNMQITQTRFGKFNILMSFNKPSVRPTAEPRRPSPRQRDNQLSL